jgi:hypothetical protein
VICQEKPQQSLHQPHWLSTPLLPDDRIPVVVRLFLISVAISKEKASLCLNAGPPLIPRQKMPRTMNSTINTTKGRDLRHSRIAQLGSTLSIKAAGFSTAGQSVQFRSRAKLAIT